MLAGCHRIEEGWPEDYSAQKSPVPGSGDWKPGEERTLPSLCTGCPAACGVLVRVVEGRAVKVAGNPHHPVSRGTLCPRGQALLQRLYNPDRVRGPLRRVGRRGGGDWEPVSWDDAIARVTTALRETRKHGPPEAVFLDGGPECLGALAARRLSGALGSSCWLHADAGPEEATALACYLTQGVRDIPAIDYERTAYVLSFSTTWLEEGPIEHRIRAFAYWHRGRPGQRAKFVQFEPRWSMTAAKADEWVPLRLGTEGAVALGIAHVLLREGLEDRKFVEAHVTGLEDEGDRKGFRRLVRDRYSPERVAEISGVSPGMIVRLAREAAAHHPAIAVGNGAAGLSTNGVFSAMAIHSLNALLGTLDGPGGLLTQRTAPGWPPDPPGGQSPLPDEARILFPRGRLAALEEAVDEPRILLLRGCDPLFSSPDTAVLEEAFRTAELIVSFSSYLDDSAAVADLVLPESVEFERSEVVPAGPAVGYPALSIVRPAVRPLYDTLPSATVLCRIAAGLGDRPARWLPWKDAAELADAAVHVLDGARTGEDSRATSPVAFRNAVFSEGGWWAPPYVHGRWSEVFRTPSGKFELRSTLLRQEVESLIPEHGVEDSLAKLRIEAPPEDAFLPHHETPRVAGGAREYPFFLVVFPLLALGDGRDANSPWLQEIPGSHGKVRWTSWVEIHPEAAKALGVAEHDEVRIESPAGAERARVRIVPGAFPEVVAMPLGRGHRGLGRYARRRGANPQKLLVAERDLLSGIVPRAATRVRIVRS